MKEKIMDIKTKIKPWHWWVILIAIFSIVGGISVWSMTKESYEVLYSGLSTKDSQEIERYLSKEGIAYKMNEDNGSISVLAADTSKVKMELASKGLPNETSVGFELLDGTNLGSTKDDRLIQYKRALKGQLEKDLVNGIEGIEKATVHFETPNTDNIFLDDAKEEAKATVILGLATGTKLNESQIGGIQHLISAAIEGLKAENVVIVDDQGAVISDGEGDASSSTNQMDIVQQTENRIKNDIVKSLASVFGYDSVQVTVRADINFDEIIQNIERYDPLGTLVSKQENKENTVSKENGGQEVGTESNADVPEYQMEDGGDGIISSSSKEELIENFEVGKTVETIKKNPELTYLSVSVAIDQSMTEEEIEKLEEHVAVAAGIADKNNDGKLDNGKVIVTPFVFKQSVPDDVAEDVVETTNGLPIEVIIGIALFVIVLIFAIFVLVARNRKAKKKAQLLAEQQRLTAEMESDSMLQVLSANKARDMEDEEGMDEEALRHRQNLSREATEVAEENPRRTAEYINKLINEG